MIGITMIGITTTHAKRWLEYAIASGILALTLGIAFLLDNVIPHASLALLFLTGVLLVSVYAGLILSLLASVLSFMAYNFFFTVPYHTFDVAEKSDLTMLVFFLVIATIAGNLTARMRLEMGKRYAALQRMSNLYEFSRRMSSATGSKMVLDALADHLSTSLGMPVVVVIKTAAGKLQEMANSGSMSPVPVTVIEQAWAQAGLENVYLQQCRWLTLGPGTTAVGMVGIQGVMDVEQTGLAGSLCEQAAVALDRTRLVSDLDEARLVSETEQLRSALLSSISHDLRTPLAAIIGSVTSLLDYGDAFKMEDRRELLLTVSEEAQRLDRYIQNLLDMTRLGQGGLDLKRDWVDLHDIIATAMSRLRESIRDLSVDINIHENVPLLWVHGVLIEQAVVNLLDNAIRFSPPHGRITIGAQVITDQLTLTICDEGPGIPVDEREKVFDMFYTVKRGDRGDLQGTGLGLAICRGMINAHGGMVSAESGPGERGTCMRIMLPLHAVDKGLSS